MLPLVGGDFLLQRALGRYLAPRTGTRGNDKEQAVGGTADKWIYGIDI
jgi:hypothetical protein